MSKKTISAGDATFVIGNKTNTAFARYREWHKRDPAVAVGQVALAGAQPSTRGELVRALVRSWQIGRTVVNVLGRTHAALAGRWMTTVRGSGRPVSSVDDTHPANYSEPMAELKNLRWPGWDGSAVKGYCVFEPAVRMQQLLAFPVEQFGQPQLPRAPEWPQTPVGAHDHRPLGKDLNSEILECQDELHAWEKYYDELAEKLVRLNQAFECDRHAAS